VKLTRLSTLRRVTRRGTRRCAWLLGSLAAVSACGGGGEEMRTASMASRTAAAANLAAPQATRSPTSTTQIPETPVSYADGTLSVRDGADLRSALAQIEKRTGIAVIMAPSLGAPRVVRAVAGAPLVDGLLQLLGDYDVLLSFRATGQSQSTLQTLWVYPKGRGPLPARAAPQVDRDRTAGAGEAATAEEWYRRLLSAVPADRLNSLSESIDTQIELPEPALLQLAGTDPNPLARRLALIAIGRTPPSNSPAARTAAHMALQDADQTVREQAKDLLEQLDMAALPDGALPLAVVPPPSP